MKFINKLQAIWQKNNSLLCVGLDPDPSRFPGHFTKSSAPIFQFNKAIIDATHDVVCAFKPQIAYFSAVSAENQLEQTIDYIKQQYPHIPIILDAKRGDIGSTAQQYAKEAFERYEADAVTVNPYLGYDAVQPFLAYPDKATILLCRTSNRGAAAMQDLKIAGEPLYQRVARLGYKSWDRDANCLLVVGGTAPAPMRAIRKLVGTMPFLVPGVGAQGGDIKALVQAGQPPAGTGLIISSSRAVLYASKSPQFAEAARTVAIDLRNQINTYRNNIKSPSFPVDRQN